MGYKALGYIVWQGGKWYARRRLPGTTGRFAMAGLGAAVLAGILVTGRRAASSSE